MHDLDHTLSEFEDEFEFEGEYESEFEFEDDADAVGSVNRPFDDAREMELAAELLSVQSDDELEYFLGNVINAVGKFAKSSAGKTLGKALKGVAKKALPVVGGALGSLVAPGVGTAIGSKLGSAASGLFEMELEGLSPEDQEFEVARRVVRLAGDAAKNVANTPSGVPPTTAAKAAIKKAARKHAPDLAREMDRGASGQGRGRTRPSGARPSVVRHN